MEGDTSARSTLLRKFKAPQVLQRVIQMTGATYQYQCPTAAGRVTSQAKRFRRGRWS